MNVLLLHLFRTSAGGVSAVAVTAVSSVAGAIAVFDVASSVGDVATVGISSLTGRNVAGAGSVTAPGSTTRATVSWNYGSKVSNCG